MTKVVVCVLWQEANTTSPLYFHDESTSNVDGIPETSFENSITIKFYNFRLKGAFDNATCISKLTGRRGG